MTNEYNSSLAVPIEICPTCGEDRPFSGTCGTSDSDTKALCKRKCKPSQEPGKCTQCKKPYRKGADTKGCPKCAPGVDVPESEFQKPISAPSQPVTLTESERVKCLVASGCIGTVKMTYDSGPYEITRTSINADRLIDAIIAALREKEKAK